MRYAQIRSMDISNGEGIGISLFVQGCHLHCTNCFNSETWDFNGGKEYLISTYKEIEELADKPYVTRFSILGGDPLALENVQDVYSTVVSFKKKYPNKKIWLYSGYTFEEIMNVDETDMNSKCRKAILNYIDVLVDGRYIDSLRDMNLKFRGSSNQRVIDVKETLKQNKIILLTN